MNHLFCQIEELFAGQKPSQIAALVEQRIKKYAEGVSVFFTSYEDRLGYVAVRMPATVAAQKRALELCSIEGASSLLDFGAGPGSSLFALSIPPQKAILVDQDIEMMEIGKKLSPSAKAVWQSTLPKEGQFDLVLASYSLNEVQDKKALLTSLWERTGKDLLIVEPGTRKGYQNILEAREFLLAFGAYIKAPCPHAQACPLVGSDKWCHFKQRVPRSALCRYLKNAELSYEDENFSFICFSKQKNVLSGKRIIGRPRQEKGRISFDFCCEDGRFIHESLLKRNLTKEQQKASWGDSI